MFGLVELEFRLDGEGEARGGYLNFFLHILSSLVNTKNWLCILPGSALKVPGGGWVV